MAIATGQFTIVDYSDAVQLTSWIKIGGTTNTATQKTIIYDPGAVTYSPNWGATGKNLVLSPIVTKPDSSGGSTPIDVTSTLQNVRWSKILNGVTTQLAWGANGSKSTVLTTSTTTGETDTYLNESGTTLNDVGAFGIKVTSNKLSTTNTALTYLFEAQYPDPISGLKVDVKATVDFSLIQNGANIASARVFQVTDDTFMNQDDTATLQLGAELLRGVNSDTTLSYQWFIQDTTVYPPTTLASASTASATTITVASVAGMTVGAKIKVGTESTARTITAINSSTKVVTLSSGLTSAWTINTSVVHPDRDSDVGDGWAKLTDTANMYTGCTTADVAQSFLTVYAKAVTAVTTFKCKITDTESGLKYYDQYTLYDKGDPYQVTIFSPGGNAFKNNLGSTVLQALITRNGNSVTTKSDGSAFTVKFYMYDQNGVKNPNFNGVGVDYKLGSTQTFNSISYPNSIIVNATDITVKATFVVEIS